MKTKHLKLKLFGAAVILFVAVAFANEPAGGTCDLDATGACECVATLDGSGTITGYKCVTAVSNPVTSKCVCK